MNGTISLVVLIAVIIFVVIMQVRSFIKTKALITNLSNFFPDLSDLKLKQMIIAPGLDKSKLSDAVIKSTIKVHDDKEIEDGETVKIITSPNLDTHSLFGRVLVMTNIYLCKNQGAAADLDSVQAPCEQAIDAIEDEIEKSINTPLYFGLGGTFLGIIFGLLGLVIENNEQIDFSDTRGLLIGVAIAMGASLVGLILTILNSGHNYKAASSKVLADKQNYYGFIRQELLPILTVSMASSLGSLKSVLGHFVDKFGHNLDAYADSAAMLNDNIGKQHLVLQEINNMNLTQTATTIANTFKTLKESADSLGVFKTYQDSLNNTISQLSTAVTKIDTLVASFGDFGNSLAVVTKNQEVTQNLQQQFKESIETHFPKGSEGREAWRKEFDTLIEDAQNASSELQAQLSQSSTYIKDFVENNSSFLTTFDKLEEIMNSLVQYTQVQSTSYTNLATEIAELKKECKNAQVESLKSRTDVADALKEMTSALHSIRLVQESTQTNTKEAVMNDIAKALTQIAKEKAGNK